MKNYFSNKLRELRRNADVTQDRLAEVLGVTPQTVSKWERAETYPDIETLPGIANYFGVSIDELLGNDKQSERRDIEENFLRYLGKLNDEAWFDLCLFYLRKYPRDPQVATLFLQQLSCNCREKLPEYAHLAYETCEQLLADCADRTYRYEAVRSICFICPEEEVERWHDKLSQVWSPERLDVWAQRCRCLDDERSHRAFVQAANFYEAVNMTARLYESEGEESEPTFIAAWYETVIRTLGGLSGVATLDDVPDGWMSEYEYALIRLSAACFSIGENDKGYIALERSVALYERWTNIPDAALLDLGNPLVYGETKIVKSQPLLLLTNGKQCPFHYRGFYAMENLPGILSATSGWDGFDAVRNEDKFKQLCARVLTVEKRTE